VITPRDGQRDDRVEFAARAMREKVNLSDYIRVRLGLRALGPKGDCRNRPLRTAEIAPLRLPKPTL
jgi:hypothetical protein